MERIQNKQKSEGTRPVRWVLTIRKLAPSVTFETIVETHRIASPNASAESFSFMASSMAFLGLLLEPFFFFFFLLLLSEAPPRSLSVINGRDPSLNVGDIVDVVAGLIPVAIVKDEQRITNDISVLIVQDCDILVRPGSLRMFQKEALNSCLTPTREGRGWLFLLLWISNSSKDRRGSSMCNNNNIILFVAVSIL